MDVEQLIFLDESGATTQMTRNYGRAPRGQRVNEATPQGRWEVLTMLAALTVRGLEAPITIAAPTDGDIFLAYSGAGFVSSASPWPGGDHGQLICAQSSRSA